MPLQKPNPSQISQFVREFRRVLGLTQAQFGHKVGVSYETVNRWENGRMHPSPLALRQLERVVQEFTESSDAGSKESAERLLDFLKNLITGN